MQSFAKRTLTKFRAILSLGAIAGVAGALFGGVWTLAALRLQYGFFPDLTNWFFLTSEILPNVLEWGVRGAMSGVGFGGVLSLLESRTSLHQLPVWRVGLYGALIGVTLVEGTLLFRALTGPLVFSEAVLATLPAASAIGILGAMLSTSVVVIAKRSERVEIAGAQERADFLVTEH